MTAPTERRRVVLAAPSVASQAASEELTRALLDVAAQGLRTHCSDVELHGYWLSENQTHRAVAAMLCVGCPVFGPCGEVGRYQSFGVFAGVDRTRTNKPKSSKSRAPDLYLGEHHG